MVIWTLSNKNIHRNLTDGVLILICVTGSENLRQTKVVAMTDEYIAELKAEEGPNFHEEYGPLYMELIG